jgi:tetratricopeptide (TPR) repeat protein
MFLVAMFAFRGLRGGVPLLFGFGLSGLFAWASVQAGRLLWRGDARIQRIVLKREGRWRVPGIVFAAVMLLAFSGLAFAIREQAGLMPGGRTEMARLLVQAGEMHAGDDDQTEAVRIFERALQFDPGSVEAHRGLAMSLCRTGRIDEGLVEFGRALAADPLDADTHARMAAALLAKQDAEPALQHAREAVRLAPGRGDLHLFLAQILDAMGHSAEAARERALSQGASEPAPH